MPQSTRSKIGSYLLAAAIIGAGAVYVYYVYGPSIAQSIDDIMKGRVGDSLANDPLLGNKNPLDEALSKLNPFQSRGTETTTYPDNKTQPVQTYNLPKVNKTVPTIGEILRRSNAGFLYSMAAEEERPEP